MELQMHLRLAVAALDISNNLQPTLPKLAGQIMVAHLQIIIVLNTNDIINLLQQLPQPVVMEDNSNPSISPKTYS